MHIQTFRRAFEVVTMPGLLHVRIGKLNLQVETWCRFREFGSWQFFWEYSPIGPGTYRAVIGPFEFFMHFDK